MRGTKRDRHERRRARRTRDRSSDSDRAARSRVAAGSLPACRAPARPRGVSRNPALVTPSSKRRRVHPAFVDQVVHRRPVVADRDRRAVPARRRCISRTPSKWLNTSADACLGALEARRNRELPREKSARPRCVDDEARVELERLAHRAARSSRTRIDRTRAPSARRDRDSRRRPRPPRARSDDRRRRAASACRRCASFGLAATSSRSESSRASANGSPG